MFKFIRTAQITSYFTTSLDRKLSYALEGMDGVKDFSEFNVRMAKMDANKIADYKSKNYIDACSTMRWNDFKTFKEKRTEALRAALIIAFK